MRLLTPSSTPCLPPNPGGKALDLLFVSGDIPFKSGEKPRLLRSAGIKGLSAGFSGLNPIGIGCVAEPFRELGRCTVTAEEPEAEFGLEFWRGMTGSCSVEVITRTVGRFGNHAATLGRLRELFPDAFSTCGDGMQYGAQK